MSALRCRCTEQSYCTAEPAFLCATLLSSHLRAPSSQLVQALLHAPLLRTHYLLNRHSRARCSITADGGFCVNCELASGQRSAAAQRGSTAWLLCMNGRMPCAALLHRTHQSRPQPAFAPAPRPHLCRMPCSALPTAAAVPAFRPHSSSTPGGCWQARCVCMWVRSACEWVEVKRGQEATLSICRALRAHRACREACLRLLFSSLQVATSRACSSRVHAFFPHTSSCRRSLITRLSLALLQVATWRGTSSRMPTSSSASYWK